jgi:hypothetical protein
VGQASEFVQCVPSSKPDLSAQWSFERSDESSTVKDYNLYGPLLRVLNVTNVRVKLAYKGADKSLARSTSRCILFDGENISFDASLVIYTNSNNIPTIMIINRIYETQNLLSL